MDPRAEMGPSVGWNSLLIGLFWLELCSNGFRRGLIRLWPAGLNWHFKAETDLNFLISSAYLHFCSVSLSFFRFCYIFMLISATFKATGFITQLKFSIH